MEYGGLVIYHKKLESGIFKLPQRKLDFQGFDVLPEEKSLAEQTQKQIIEYKIRRTLAKNNDKPVRQNLPDSLERREERIRPSHPFLSPVANI